VVVGGGEWGAKRPIPLPPSQPVDGVISTKKRSEASFAGRNLFPNVIPIRRLAERNLISNNPEIIF